MCVEQFRVRSIEQIYGLDLARLTVIPSDRVRLLSLKGMNGWMDE